MSRPTRKVHHTAFDLDDNTPRGYSVSLATTLRYEGGTQVDRGFDGDPLAHWAS
jgi:hypothetical protein